MEPSGAHERGEAVAREIGRRLREVRVARGETLEAIGKRMLVKPGHLEALEAGELDRLPSRHHAAGYARSYAKQLGLDGDELAARCWLSAAGRRLSPTARGARGDYRWNCRRAARAKPRPPSSRSSPSRPPAGPSATSVTPDTLRQRSPSPRR